MNTTPASLFISQPATAADNPFASLSLALNSLASPVNLFASQNFSR